MSINTRRPGVIKNVDADAAGGKKRKSLWDLFSVVCVNQGGAAVKERHQ